MIVKILVKDSPTVNTLHVEKRAIFDDCIICNKPRSKHKTTDVFIKHNLEKVNIVECDCCVSIAHAILAEEDELIKIVIDAGIHFR